NLDAPIKLIWSRDDDTTSGYYRPLFAHHVAAALDWDGKPLAWAQTNVGQSLVEGTHFESAFLKDGVDRLSVEGAAEMTYAIPNIQVDLHTPKVPVPVGWFRSVGHSHNAFVKESFIDELAHAANHDPVDYRRALLANDPRLLAVLELAAQKADWTKPLPEGQ